MSIQHNFNAQLRYSEDPKDDAFWINAYRSFFPNFAGAVLNSGKNEGQYRGVDRLVYLSNDRVLRIDEKKREGRYNDMLIEYLSNDQTGAVGWIEKPLAIDYIAYAVMATRQVRLLDWLTLQRAWFANRDTWKRECFHVQARNPGYVTHSVAVPFYKLLRAMNEVSLIQVK